MASERLEFRPLSQLRLDPENPRLPSDADWHATPEEDLLAEFAKRYSLIELARSFADKGFMPAEAEALLVVQEPQDADTLIVVEGNRRLATLKLLSDENLRRKANLRSPEWDELAELAKHHELTQIPVLVYDDRADLDDYLGYRHITGPRPWRPEAKARFIAKLLTNTGDVGIVARRIGSNHRTVRLYAEAYAIYEQAKALGFDVEPVEAGFGVFNRGLTEEGIRSFLGLGRQSEIKKMPKYPVAIDKQDRLLDLIGLLYGDSDRKLEAVIADSRQLGKLGRVLGNETSRAHLMVNRDLERAWHLGGGGRNDLLATLADLYSKLAEVNGKALEYTADEEVREEIRRIRDVVGDMANRYGVDAT